jgi:hypothetical protein
MQPLIDMSESWDSSLSLQLRRSYGLFSRLDLADVLLRYQEQTSQGRRPLLSAPLLNHLCSFGPVGQGIVDPPSSDEDSDVETGRPSLRTAIDSVLDSKLCETSETPLIVSYHKPALILLNIRPALAPAKLRAGLKDLCDSISKVQVVAFPLETGFCRCGIIYLDSDQTAQRLYAMLKREADEGLLNQRSIAEKDSFRSLSVRYFRYQALDPAISWTAVVIRDLDRSTTPEDIRSLLHTKGLHPTRIEPPRSVNAGYCALIVFQDMDSPDRLCRIYHKKLTLGGIWKAHVHPQSHMVKQTSRNSPQTSAFDYTDLYQMMQTSKSAVAAAATEDPLKRLIRKRPNPN